MALCWLSLSWIWQCLTTPMGKGLSGRRKVEHTLNIIKSLSLLACQTWCWLGPLQSELWDWMRKCLLLRNLTYSHVGRLPSHRTERDMVPKPFTNCKSGCDPQFIWAIRMFGQNVWNNDPEKLWDIYSLHMVYIIQSLYLPGLDLKVNDK